MIRKIRQTFYAVMFCNINVYSFASDTQKTFSTFTTFLFEI